MVFRLLFLLISFSSSFLSAEGVYLIVQMYSPKVPDQLPEGETFANYLLNTPYEKIEFEPDDLNTWIFVPDPTVFYIEDGVESYKKGVKMASPVDISYSDTKMEVSFQVEGAFLFEVLEAGKDLNEMAARYKRLQDEEGNLVKGYPVIRVKDGKFLHHEKDESVTLRMSGGPFEEGWSEKRKRESIEMSQKIFKAYGCFIATAIYGNLQAREVQVFRKYRDEVLMNSRLGMAFIEVYYRYSPQIAAKIEENPKLKKLIKPFLDYLVDIIDD